MYVLIYLVYVIRLEAPQGKDLMFYTSKALHTPIELYKYLLQNEFVLLL